VVSLVPSTALPISGSTGIISDLFKITPKKLD